MDNKLRNECEVEYCNFYKCLMVEELSLCEYPHLLHYGKCAVIGSISQSKSGLYHLNNIKLNSIEKDYQIPSNSTSVVLLDTLIVGKVRIGAVCEVYGEAVLYDNIKEDRNILPTTSKDLILEMANFSVNESEDNWQDKLKMLKAQYLPAIRAHSLNIVDQPAELIECNLKIRCLKSNRLHRA